MHGEQERKERNSILAFVGIVVFVVLGLIAIVIYMPAQNERSRTAVSPQIAPSVAVSNSNQRAIHNAQATATARAGLQQVQNILDGTPVKNKPTATRVPRNKRKVTATQLGTDWPLTVSSGYVIMSNCNKLRQGLVTSSHIFETESGKKYALNGYALQDGYPNIQQITKKVYFGSGPDDWLYRAGIFELSKIARRMCRK